MYGIVLASEGGIDAVTLQQELSEQGIESRPFFLGLHQQPVFREAAWARCGSYPVAESLARNGLYLPSALDITEREIETVSAAVQRAVA